MAAPAPVQLQWDPSSSSRSKRITPQQWETHKTQITDLYLKNSLDVVKSEMKRFHGFAPSDRQYRYQLFDKWGLRKYETDAGRPSREMDRDDASSHIVSSQIDPTKCSLEIGIPPDRKKRKLVESSTSLSESTSVSFECQHDGSMTSEPSSIPIAGRDLHTNADDCHEEYEVNKFPTVYPIDGAESADSHSRESDLPQLKKQKTMATSTRHDEISNTLERLYQINGCKNTDFALYGVPDELSGMFAGVRDLMDDSRQPGDYNQQEIGRLERAAIFLTVLDAEDLAVSLYTVVFDWYEVTRPFTHFDETSSQAEVENSFINILLCGSRCFRTRESLKTLFGSHSRNLSRYRHGRGLSSIHQCLAELTCLTMSDPGKKSIKEIASLGKHLINRSDWLIGKSPRLWLLAHEYIVRTEVLIKWNTTERNVGVSPLTELLIQDEFKRRSRISSCTLLQNMKGKNCIRSCLEWCQAQGSKFRMRNYTDHSTSELLKFLISRFGIYTKEWSSKDANFEWVYECEVYIGLTAAEILKVMCKLITDTVTVRHVLGRPASYKAACKFLLEKGDFELLEDFLKAYLPLDDVVNWARQMMPKISLMNPTSTSGLLGDSARTGSDLVSSPRVPNLQEAPSTSILDPSWSSSARSSAASSFHRLRDRIISQRVRSLERPRSSLQEPTTVLSWSLRKSLAFSLDRLSSRMSSMSVSES